MVNHNCFVKTNSGGNIFGKNKKKNKSASSRFYKLLTKYIERKNEENTVF